MPTHLQSGVEKSTAFACQGLQDVFAILFHIPASSHFIILPKGLRSVGAHDPRLLKYSQPGKVQVSVVRNID